MLMSLKEKVYDKILSKSNSYEFYKNYYENNYEDKSNAVAWDHIFKMVSVNKEMFDITMESVYEHFSNGKNEMKICPICNHTTPIFIAGGVNYRKDARCPICNSLERHRFLYFFIKNKFDLNKNIKLLHFAPEESFFNIFENLNNIEYYTGDIVKSPCVKEIIDIQNIPYDDDYFNLIICNHVLEHVPDDEKAMKELHRVIKPVNEKSGVIIMVPLDLNSYETLEKEEYNTPELRKKYYGQEDHLRMYGRDFKEKLEKVGFTVEVFDIDSSFFKDSERYGFGSGDIIFYCTKQ